MNIQAQSGNCRNDAILPGFGGLKKLKAEPLLIWNRGRGLVAFDDEEFNRRSNSGNEAKGWFPHGATHHADQPKG